MLKKLREFAGVLGLILPDGAEQILAAYADLVWQKKDILNLTSVSSADEIYTRHLCDGLVAAALFDRLSAGKERFTVADMGSGAGYIGLTVAAALPQAQVTLVECLEKRCRFLNWAIGKLALPNATVCRVRLGQQPAGRYDFVTERAMGELNDILPLCAEALNNKGTFVAYQSTSDAANAQLVEQLGLEMQSPLAYTLPGEQKERYLVAFGIK